MKKNFETKKKIAHHIDQIVWRVEPFHKEEELLQVSALTRFFWWKLIVNQICRDFSYTGLLQFFILGTVSTNTSVLKTIKICIYLNLWTSNFSSLKI